MSEQANERDRKGGMATGVLLAGAVSVLALPSAVLAVTTRFEPAQSATDVPEIAKRAEPATGLARPLAVRSLAKGQLFLFTPADTPSRPDRSVTVAVRVDDKAANAILVRGKRLPQTAVARTEPLETTIAPTAFSLGVARGYKGFSQGLVPQNTRKNLPGIEDLGRYSIKDKPSGDKSRFAPRIVLEETQTGGRSPRTFAGDSDDMVDVGGSYRVSNNLNVTAGVRYQQERERLGPLTDGQQDSQAVYVGTQFRF